MALLRRALAMAQAVQRAKFGQRAFASALAQQTHRVDSDDFVTMGMGRMSQHGIVGFLPGDGDWHAFLAEEIDRRTAAQP
ncbi:hypothetical protein D3C81_1318810 [compost metagenome]